MGSIDTEVVSAAASDAPTPARHFLKHNATYWFASLGVAFLNYMFYPIIGRMLNPTAFGETQTIISFLTQVAVMFQVLSLTSIGIIRKYTDVKKRDKLNSELSRLTLYVSLSLLALTILFSGMLFFNL